MLRFVQAGVWAVITVIAAGVCCFEFAGVQFWSLEPREEGFVGMGILILLLFLPTAAVLVPVSLIWLKQQIDADVKGTWWKRGLGLALTATIVLAGVSWLRAVPVTGVRVIGWVHSWGLLLFELLPLRWRFLGVF